MSQILTDKRDAVTATQSIVYGLNGNDYIRSSLANIRIYGGEGNDFLGNIGSGDSHFYGGGGDDTIHGGSGLDEIDGDDGNDLLVGGLFDYAIARDTGVIQQADGQTSGDDLLDGGSGNDTIHGFDGNDTIFGGEGDDGGNGTLTYAYPSPSPSAALTIRTGLFGDDGDDFVSGGRGNDYIDGGKGLDDLFGDGGDDTILGGADADRLNGLGGSDIMDGGSGADILNGGAGNDQMTGGAGGDTMDGGIANDVLIGGAGADILTGGLGADSFRFERSNEGGDTITDFASDDVLTFAGAGFAKLPPGPLEPNAFVANTTGAATTAAQRFLFDTDDHKLYFDADGSGAAKRVLIVTFENDYMVTASDILIV